MQIIWNSFSCKKVSSEKSIIIIMQIIWKSIVWPIFVIFRSPSSSTRSWRLATRRLPKRSWNDYSTRSWSSSGQTLLRWGLMIFDRNTLIDIGKVILILLLETENIWSELKKLNMHLTFNLYCTVHKEKFPYFNFLWGC